MSIYLINNVYSIVLYTYLSIYPITCLLISLFTLNLFILFMDKICIKYIYNQIEKRKERKKMKNGKWHNIIRRKLDMPNKENGIDPLIWANLNKNN